MYAYDIELFRSRFVGPPGATWYQLIMNHYNCCCGCSDMSFKTDPPGTWKVLGEPKEYCLVQRASDSPRGYWDAWAKLFQQTAVQVNPNVRLFVKVCEFLYNLGSWSELLDTTSYTRRWLWCTSKAIFLCMHSFFCTFWRITIWLQNIVVCCWQQPRLQWDIWYSRYLGGVEPHWASGREVHDGWPLAKSNSETWQQCSWTIPRSTCQFEGWWEVDTKGDEAKNVLGFWIHLSFVSSFEVKRLDLHEFWKVCSSPCYIIEYQAIYWGNLQTWCMVTPTRFSHRPHNIWLAPRCGPCNYPRVFRECSFSWVNWWSRLEHLGKIWMMNTLWGHLFSIVQPRHWLSWQQAILSGRVPMLMPVFAVHLSSSEQLAKPMESVSWQNVVLGQGFFSKHICCTNSLFSW